MKQILRIEHPIRLAVAVSLVCHGVLVGAFFLAKATPIDHEPPESIAVDVVSAEALKPQTEIPDAKPADQQPEPKLPDQIKIPELKFEDVKSEPLPEQAASQSAAAQQQASVPPPTAAQSAPMPSQPPAQAAAPLPPPPATGGPVAGAEPDITVKYGVMFGLPDGDGGSVAYQKADLAKLDIEAFRRHVRSCAKLPEGVSRSDKVRIVMRAIFASNGRLLVEPEVLEGSPSLKGALLKQAATAALEACQPYSMLPKDAYDQWKMLDVPFTPADFS